MFAASDNTNGIPHEQFNAGTSHIRGGLTERERAERMAHPGTSLAAQKATRKSLGQDQIPVRHTLQLLSEPKRGPVRTHSASCSTPLVWCLRSVTPLDGSRKFSSGSGSEHPQIRDRGSVRSWHISQAYSQAEKEAGQPRGSDNIGITKRHRSF